MDSVRRDTPDNDSERVLIAVPPIEAWVDKQKKEYRPSRAWIRRTFRSASKGNNLTVSGERKDNEQNEDAYYLQQEDVFTAPLCCQKG
jgi:hypothetical protein